MGWIMVFNHDYRASLTQADWRISTSDHKAGAFDALHPLMLLTAYCLPYLTAPEMYSP